MFDIISSNDEEGEHNVLNVVLEVVEQSTSGMPVEIFFELALSSHLAMDLLCQEMQDANSENCRKRRNDVLTLLCFNSVFSLVCRGRNLSSTHLGRKCRTSSCKTGMVMVGWLGRACTALHCTHHAHTHAQETPQCLSFVFFSFFFRM